MTGECKLAIRVDGAVPCDLTDNFGYLEAAMHVCSI